MTFHKPTISMRKENEVEFVNVRTYWSLDFNDDDTSYELRIKHQFPEDTFTFLSHDAARRDALELVTREQWNERVMNIREHEDMSHDDAEAWLTEHQVAVMTRGEADLLAHLRRHWDALDRKSVV